MNNQAGDRVTLCTDGKYRWVYEMSLIRNATIPLLMLKVLLITLAIVEIIMLAIALASGDDVVEMLVGSLRIMGCVLLALVPIGIVAYLLYAWRMGWYYCVVFEMDEEGVLHAQQENQVKKAGLLADMAILAGLVAGNPTTAGAGLLAKTSSSMYTEFASVRLLGSSRGRNVIYVNNNQVYVPEEDFDFVWDYIRSRCPKARRRPSVNGSRRRRVFPMMDLGSKNSYSILRPSWMKQPVSCCITCLENSSLNWNVWVPVSRACWCLSPVPSVAT